MQVVSPDALGSVLSSSGHVGDFENSTVRIRNKCACTCLVTPTPKCIDLSLACVHITVERLYAMLRGISHSCSLHSGAYFKWVEIGFSRLPHHDEVHHYGANALGPLKTLGT